MGIARVLMASVVALASVTASSVAPASARPVEEPMYGIYTYHSDGGGPDETWTIYPTCVVAGCVLHVSTTVSDSLGPNSDYPGFGGDARKSEGLWTWTQNKDKGMRCDDGTWSPEAYMYRWDQATLQGTLTKLVSPDNICGYPPGKTTQSFTLTYKQPLPIPIILDPLNQIENLW
jgi:hypothetical protein